MIAVILPCFKSSNFVLDVINRIDQNVSEIIAVDDCCPEGTGKLIEEQCSDERVKVIFRPQNGGVGSAMKTGFVEALKGNCEVIVKIDSDGQLSPEILQRFIDPILNGHADYCKGNRFYNIESLSDMPKIRLFGNSALSFLTKFSSGYWSVMDPTNGYIAVHRKVLENIPIHKLEDRFFFETDLLFRMNTIGALVLDIPMDAVYNEAESNLSVTRSLPSFLYKNAKLFLKRIFYNYFLRDFSIASINLVMGLVFFIGGMSYGISRHLHFSELNLETPTGTQVVTAILTLIGFQLLLSFITHDMNREPSRVIHNRLPTQN
ncbi:MAG: glycosyltransferase family 2 protein [Gammaproteobacteria bacterium]|nr:glycosyltransferase family 2 protein [Gammaproteobacteria bacterium]MCP4982839.1 glycosyltransferase family 2 protein [Gammaproteobacteria bacterium]